MVAIDDSASMLWARVMRGMSSIENALAPRSATACAADGSASGSEKPMRACPGRSSSMSARPASPAAPGLRTCSTTSASAKSRACDSAIRAPFSVYALSGNPASAPASVSTRTSSDAFASDGSTPGTSATRRSPGNGSRGTPTIMAAGRR